MKVVLAGLPLMWLWPQAAEAGPPPVAPQLRVEAGMHRRPVHRVDTDAKGRWLVTASDDKTARVWDANTGALQLVLRPPIAEGNEGRLFGVAMSRDGAVVAVGGNAGFEWDRSYSVYLFDRASGRMLRRLRGLQEPPYHLAYSPDGRYLAAALSGRNGVRVWPLGAEPGTASLPVADTSSGADSYAVAWSRDGTLATSSWDGKVRLFRVAERSLTLVATATTPGGARPEGLAFSPDGNELAVGQSDVPKVDILDAKTLALRHSLVATGGANGNGMGTVAWSADGKSLLAGGGWSQGGRHVIRRWSQAGRGAATDIPASEDLLSALLALPDGRVAGVSFDPMIGMVSANASGSQAWTAFVKSPTADPRPQPKTRDLFRISSDGQRVQFSFDHADKNATHQFDLSKRRLFNEADNSLQPPRLQGLPITRWEDSEFPYFGDDPMKLEPFEIARSLSIDPSNKSFVLGTSWWLRQFNAQGEQLWAQPVAAPAWSVNQTKLAKLLVVAHGDGVIRWHRAEDGKELLAFYPHADRKRWVLWTPSGYYDASVGGDGLLGWHLNRGTDQSADFFQVRHFRERLHRPDVIDRILQTLDENRADASRSAQGGATGPDVVMQSLPPVVDLLSGNDWVVNQRSVKLRVRARTAPDAPVTGWQVRVDGLLQNLPAVPAGVAERELPLNLSCDVCDIQVLAFNRFGASPAAHVRVTVTGVPKVTLEAPRLFVLAVGVSTYPNREVTRAASGAKDSQDIATAFQRQKGKAFADVQVRLLTDSEATREQIQAGLAWLKQQVKPTDVAVVLLAGHGFNSANLGYSFLPYNTAPDDLAATTLGFSELASQLAVLPGRTVLLLDTVYSDNVLGSLRKALPHHINRVVNQMAAPETGLVVFSSSSGRQPAQSEPGKGQGFFAKALVEGLDGKAAQSDGKITHSSLAAWLETRVRDLSRGQQLPVKLSAEGIPDFSLGGKR